MSRRLESLARQMQAAHSAKSLQVEVRPARSIVTEPSLEGGLEPRALPAKCLTVRTPEDPNELVFRALQRVSFDEETHNKLLKFAKEKETILHEYKSGEINLQTYIALSSSIGSLDVLSKTQLQDLQDESDRYYAGQVAFLRSMWATYFLDQLSLDDEHQKDVEHALEAATAASREAINAAVGELESSRDSATLDVRLAKALSSAGVVGRETLVASLSAILNSEQLQKLHVLAQIGSSGIPPWNSELGSSAPHKINFL